LLVKAYEVRWQAWSLNQAGLCDEMADVIRRYSHESGPKANIVGLEFLQDWYSQKDLTLRRTSKTSNMSLRIPCRNRTSFR